MRQKALTSTQQADAYRGYSAAIRIVSKLPIEDLELKYRIIHKIYEAGHVHWLNLVKLDCSDFGRAFDASRAKASR